MANIGVIGTGYVGLTTAVCFAELGHRVFGIDIDKTKIETLSSGKSTIHEVGMSDLISKNLENKNQIIIVSGESGSGKTETTKQIIHYLNSCVKNSDNKLIERIEASGIILEYFGNATTSKNTNSSRFGKLIEVYYNKNMECLGMKIITYILEKTRVLRSEEIGKFHIFNRDVNEIIDLLNKGGFTEENISFIIDNIETIKYLLNIGYGDNIKNNKLRDVLSKRTIKVQDKMRSRCIEWKEKHKK